MLYPVPTVKANLFVCTLDGRFVIDGTSVDSFHFWYRYIGQHFLEFDYFPQFSVGIALGPFTYYESIFRGLGHCPFYLFSVLKVCLCVVEFSNGGYEIRKIFA